MSENKEPDALYDYLWHYNIYTGYWNCFLRSDNDKYFNGDLKDCIKAKNVNDIIRHFKVMEIKQQRDAEEEGVTV